MVYEDMRHMSLEKQLLSDAGRRELSLLARVRVAADVSKALTFLHHSVGSNPQLHRGVQPGSILLDAKFGGKLADAGLCGMA